MHGNQAFSLRRVAFQERTADRFKKAYSVTGLRGSFGKPLPCKRQKIFPQEGVPMRTTVRTSEKDWLASTAKYYKNHDPFLLVDDAKVGVDPSTMTLLDMGSTAGLSPAEWVAVVIGLGVAAIGAWLIVMAVLDPEPYSKVASTIVAGAVLVSGGGFSAIRTLTKVKPPNVKASADGFEISWN